MNENYYIVKMNTALEGLLELLDDYGFDYDFDALILFRKDTPKFMYGIIRVRVELLRTFLRRMFNIRHFSFVFFALSILLGSFI